MELRQLELLLRLLEEGSFSRAAASLGITQPVLSRQLRALEEELGTPLLYRNGRGVIATAEGQRFADAVTPVLQELGRIRDDVRAARDEPGGKLRIAMPPSVSAALAPPLLRHLRAELPKVELHLMDGFTGTIHEWFSKGQLDIAVLNPMRRSAAVRTEPLFDAHLFLAYAPGDPQVAEWLTAEGEITLAHAARLPLFLPGRQHGVRREIDRALADSGLTPARVEDVDSLTALKHLTAEGLGCTLFAWDAIALEVRSGALAAARVIEPVLLHGFVLATSSERPVSSASRAVIRFLREEVQRQLAQGKLRGSLAE